MRQIKRISFLIYSCMLLAAGFYGHMKFQDWFYPGKHPDTATQSNSGGDEEALQALKGTGRITCDTILVTKNHDLVSGEETETDGKAAEKYIGMNREEFVRCIADETAAPSLQEREEGLFSAEVLSFSEERIVLEKYYRKPLLAEDFYLALINNMVFVYEEDRATVYMQTSIDGRELPSKLRDEILRGKEISGKADLEKFLESYSS